METYQEPAQVIVAMMRDLFKDGPIKAVFDGDPQSIPSHMLPCICVVQQASDTELGATGTDDVSGDIQLRVVFDRRDDWGVKSPANDLTQRKIRDLVEARSPDNHYLPQSIKGALRSRLQLDDNTQLRQGMHLEFVEGTRPGELFTLEGHLTISEDHYVLLY